MRKGAALAAAWLASIPAASLAGVTVEKTAGGTTTTVARMPLAPHLSFKAKVETVPNAIGVDAPKPLWLGGAGLEYRITRGLVLGAGWEHRSGTVNNAIPTELGLDPRRQLGMHDPDQLTIGLSYRF
jgi:opacity protein-like surface antigen